MHLCCRIEQLVGQVQIPVGVLDVLGQIPQGVFVVAQDEIVVDAGDDDPLRHSGDAAETVGDRTGDARELGSRSCEQGELIAEPGVAAIRRGEVQAGLIARQVVHIVADRGLTAVGKRLAQRSGERSRLGDIHGGQ